VDTSLWPGKWMIAEVSAAQTGADSARSPGADATGLASPGAVVRSPVGSG
jgi:hypothetical protein